MIDEETLAQMNGKYVCPPDAGPAWRAAMEAGIDMSLIEHNLELNYWERLLQNDRVLAFMREVQNAKHVTDGASR